MEVEKDDATSMPKSNSSFAADLVAVVGKAEKRAARTGEIGVEEGAVAGRRFFRSASMEEEGGAFPGAPSREPAKILAAPPGGVVPVDKVGSPDKSGEEGFLILSQHPTHGPHLRCLGHDEPPGARQTPAQVVQISCNYGESTPFTLPS